MPFFNFRGSGKTAENQRAPSRRTRPQTRSKLRVERLEDRRVLAVVTWDFGGESFDFGTAANWSTNTVPGATDDVVINAGIEEGAIEIVEGTYAVKSITSHDPFLISGGELEVLNSSAFFDTLEITGGELSGQGSVILNGGLDFTGGSISGTGRITANDTINVAGTGLSLVNREIDVTTSLIIAHGTDIATGDGLVINILPGSTFDIQGDMVGTEVNPNNISTVINSGLLQKSDGSGTAQLASVVNLGSIYVGAGTLLVQSFVQNSGQTELVGTTLDGDDPLVFNGGTLVGNGAVGGTLQLFTAEIAPGTSPGAMGVDDAIFDATTTTSIELGGTTAGLDHDIISGDTIALGGTLNVTLINGFSPVLGDSFSIVSATTLFGDFSTHNLPVLSEELAWQTGIDIVLGLYTLEVISSADPLTVADIDNQSMFSGAPLWVGLDGESQLGDDITYAVSSDNPSITGVIPQGNRSLWVDVDNFGVMVFELFDHLLSRPTDYFAALAELGYFDGSEFYRIVNDVIIQGGGDSSGEAPDPGTFRGEYNLNALHTGSGLLSAANHNDIVDDTNGAHFFVTEVNPADHAMLRRLDTNHSVFGVATQGEDVRAAISDVTTGANGEPLVPIIMNSVGVINNDNENAALMLEAPLGFTGSATITVTATDEHGNQVVKQFDVSSLPDSFNTAPFLTEMDQEYTTTSGTALEIQLGAIDREGDPLFFQAGDFLTTPPFTLDINHDTGLLTVTPDQDFVGEFQILAGVKSADDSEDVIDLFDTDTLTITVKPNIPNVPDLLAPFDSGNSSTDDVTNQTTLDFLVDNVIAGASVSLFADGVQIGNATASGTSVVITTTNASLLTHGVHQFTAKQTLGSMQSDASVPVDITIDTVAPVFSVSTPITTPVDELYTVDASSGEEGSPGFQYGLLNQPAGMTINANTGVISWTPNGLQTGEINYIVRATDLAGNSNDQPTTVTVVGDLPAVPDDYELDEDSSLGTVEAGVLDNDGDEHVPEGLSAELVSDVSHGTLDFDIYGAFTYTPDINFFGTDTFTYTASDGERVSNVATVTLVVHPTQDPPVANVDSYQTNEDTPLITNSVTGVLNNDTDVDGDALTAQLDTGTQHGTVALNGDGSFSYQPLANFVGFDSFVYNITDGVNPPVTATATIEILPANDAPIGNIESYNLNEDDSITVDAQSGVLANDTDVENTSLAAELITPPTHGSLTFNPDGSFNYQPNTNFAGTDAFTYRADDGNLKSGPTIVTLNVAPINDTPVALNDSYQVPEDNTLAVAVLQGVQQNDSDIDGDSLQASAVTQPQNGTLSLQTDGSFTYTPNPGFSGTDAFQYVVNDGTVDSPTATVTITIDEVNDAPNAILDKYSIDEDGQLQVPVSSGVLDNDNDPGGTNLTASLVSSTTNGALLLNANGSFTYTPNSNFFGTDSFTYLANDGELDSSPQQAVITVLSVNDPPTAGERSDQTATNQHASLEIDLFALFDDVEDSDSELSYSTNLSVEDPLFASVDIDQQAGLLTIVYADGVAGNRTVDVTATDSNEGEVTETFQLLVDRALTITDVAIAPGSDTGILGDNVTSIASPVLALQIFDQSFGNSLNNVTINADLDNDGQFDDGTIVTLIQSGATPIVNFPLTGPLPLGQQILSFQAIDAVGNTSVSQFEVSIDRTSPTIQAYHTTITPNGFSITVELSEELLPTTAEQLTNYRLIDLGFEEVIADGIASAVYTSGDPYSGILPSVTITVETEDGLPDGLYLFEFLGSQITDVAANSIAGGDTSITVELNRGVPEVLPQGDGERVRAVSPTGNMLPDLLLVELGGPDLLANGGVLQAGNYTLEQLDDTGSVVGEIVLGTPIYDPHADRIMLTTPTPLAVGDYQLTISTDGDFPLETLAGVALDGDGDEQAGGTFSEQFTVAEPGTEVQFDDALLEGSFEAVDDLLMDILPDIAAAEAAIVDDALAVALLAEIQNVIAGLPRADSTTVANAINAAIESLFVAWRDSEFALYDFNPSEFVVAWGFGTSWQLTAPNNDPDSTEDPPRIGGSINEFDGAVTKKNGNDLSVAIFPVKFEEQLFSSEFLTREDGVSASPNMEFLLSITGIAAANQVGIVAFGTNGAVGSNAFVDTSSAGLEQTVDLSTTLSGVDPNLDLVTDAVLSDIQTLLGDDVGGLTSYLVIWFDPIDFRLEDAAGNVSDHVGTNSSDGASGTFFADNGFTEYLIIPNALADVYDLSLVGVGENFRGAATLVQGDAVRSIPLQGHLASSENVAVQLDFRVDTTDQPQQFNPLQLATDNATPTVNQFFAFDAVASALTASQLILAGGSFSALGYISDGGSAGVVPEEVNVLEEMMQSLLSAADNLTPEEILFESLEELVPDGFVWIEGVMEFFGMNGESAPEDVQDSPPQPLDPSLPPPPSEQATPEATQPESTSGESTEPPSEPSSVSPTPDAEDANEETPATPASDGADLSAENVDILLADQDNQNAAWLALALAATGQAEASQKNHPSRTGKDDEDFGS